MAEKGMLPSDSSGLAIDRKSPQIPDRRNHGSTCFWRCRDGLAVILGSGRSARTPAMLGKEGRRVSLQGRKVHMQGWHCQRIEAQLQEGRSMKRYSVLASAAIVAALVGTASPAMAQAPPRVLGCSNAPDRTLCLSSVEQIRNEAQALARGGYQAMRNAAFCQWSGCDGAVAIDRKSACAWRREVMRRHYKPGGEAALSDEINLGLCVRTGN
jgi:hypothetical protein